MSRPNIDQLDRDALDDQALVSPVGDNTPDMRTAPVNPVLPAPAGTAANQPIARKEVL